jgi:hypothetical protein
MVFMSEANKIPLCKGGWCVAPGGFMPQINVKTAKSLLRCALSPFTKVRKLIRLRSSAILLKANITLH